MKQGTAVLVVLLLMAMIQCGIAQTNSGSIVQEPASKEDASPQVYSLPFASSGNSIELTVANTGIATLTGVKVNVTDVPSWLRFTSTEQTVSAVKAQQELPATFDFSVDKTAPVNKNQALRFVISASSGESWTKEITVSVAPPDKFELYQNFPNPFNPTTAISYQLSAESRVSLKVYNMLGQEVVSLVDEDQLPGYHREMWDAMKCASGVYVYQIIATEDNGQRCLARRRMMLIK